MDFDWLQGTKLEHLPAFATSLAIGLLIGLERERHPGAKAGLRTFALVALFGSIASFLSERLASPWLLVAGLALIGAMIVAAYMKDEGHAEPGTTTVIALLLAYALAAMVWFGFVQLAVMLAIVTVSLLYFKAELHGITHSLTRRDLISMLQFAVLTFIVLPILPNRDYGPYKVINPYELWMLVVLIVGVNLAGYVALRFIGQRYGAPLLGFFGGLVSSTATTLVYARYTLTHAAMQRVAVIVIVIASVVVLLRIAVIATVFAPGITTTLLPVLASGFVVGSASLLFWRRRGKGDEEPPMPDIKNPTELRTALTFGALYAVVVLISAWLSDVAGNAGLYALALISGLSDVDAISLSILRLFNVGQVTAHQATVAMIIAVISNIGFKLGMVLVVAGPALFVRCAGAMAAVAAGLVAALVLV